MKRELKLSDYFVHVSKTGKDLIKTGEWSEEIEINIVFPNSMKSIEKRKEYAKILAESYLFQMYADFDQLIEKRNMVFENELNIYKYENKQENRETNEIMVDAFIKFFYEDEIEYFTKIHNIHSRNIHVKISLERYLNFCKNRIFESNQSELKTQQTSMLLKTNIQNFLAAGKTLQALDMALGSVQDSELHNSVVLLKARFTQNERDNNLGLLARDEYMRANAQIINGLLQLISSLTENTEPQQTAQKMQTELNGYQETLDLLIRKKNFLHNELAISYDSEKRFALTIQTEALEKQISGFKEKVVKAAGTANKVNVGNNSSNNIIISGVSGSNITIQQNQAQIETLLQNIDALKNQLSEMRVESKRHKNEILQGQISMKAEIIQSITDLTESQTQAIWADIAAIFIEFEKAMDEKLLEQVQQIKSTSSLKTKLELSIPFIQMLGVNYKVEFDVVGWAKKMYQKHELKIFKSMGML